MHTQASAKQTAWQEVRTVEDFVRTYPERARSLLNSLDLSRDEMSDVREVWDEVDPEDAASALFDEKQPDRDSAGLPGIANGGNDPVAACRALLGHYRESDQISWLRDLSAEKNEKVIRRADEILQDVYHGFGEKGKMPRTSGGHIDWTHTGPKGDNQFANRVNRHSHLRTLMRAYAATDEKKYLRRLDRDLRDWLTASGGEPSADGFGTSHLEPGLRMPTWASVFYGLQDETEFRPATRLLLLSAIPAHAEYLLKHPGGGNWVSMTQYGALTSGVCWPEFEGAGRWREGAVSRLQRNARNTVYPDGAQKELTAHYHMVTLSRYSRVYKLLDRAGHAVPESFAETIEGMWDYIAYALRPDGTRPLNNDSDLGSERRDVIKAARRHERPGWLHIATNGDEGEEPDGPPSHCFPWAGQMVSRSGWDAEAHWSFFDVGPSGYGGHRHLDFGHLSITAYGRDLLVDSGRFAYQGWVAHRFRRPYAMHTRGHNTILINGQPQGTEPDVVAEPMEGGQHWQSSDDYDFARGTWSSFQNVEGKLRHHRSLLYLRGGGWIVVDHIETDRPRRLEPLWHFHPDCTVAVTETGVRTENEKGNLSVTPVGEVDWRVEVVEGQDEPHPQGWYSEDYGDFEAASCARFAADIEQESTFAWVIWPSRGEAKIPEAKLTGVGEDMVTMKLSPPGKDGLTVRVPITGGNVRVGR
jgi:hypothetical protein